MFSKMPISSYKLQRARSVSFHTLVKPRIHCDMSLSINALMLCTPKIKTYWCMRQGKSKLAKHTQQNKYQFYRIYYL